MKNKDPDEPFSFSEWMKELKDHVSDSMKAKENKIEKSKRPIKMPKNYDWNVRNVDWSQYKDDYLLRTDAVWERSKLLDLFYTHYKSPLVYD